MRLIRYGEPHQVFSVFMLMCLLSNSFWEPFQNELISFIHAADEEIHDHKHCSCRQNSTASLANLIPQKSLPLSLPYYRPEPNQSPLDSSPHSWPFLKHLLPRLLRQSSTRPPTPLTLLLTSSFPCSTQTCALYQVSPIPPGKKNTMKALTSLFGMSGPHAGGVSVLVSSARDMTAIVTAHNTLYPATKIHGNAHSGWQLVLFMSARGH